MDWNQCRKSPRLWIAALLLAIALWVLLQPLQLTNAKLQFPGGAFPSEAITVPFSAESNLQLASFAITGSLSKAPLQSTLVRLVPDDCLMALAVNNIPIPLSSDSKKRCWPEVITLDLAPYLQPGPNHIRMNIQDNGWFYGMEMKPVGSKAAWLLLAALALLMLPPKMRLPAITKQDMLSAVRRWYKHALIVVVSLGIAGVLKYYLFDFQGGDYRWFLGPWMRHIRHYGLINAYGFNFTNYAPLYPYLLGIFDLFFPEMFDLHAVKALSFIGEGVAAFFVYRLIAMYRGEHSLMALAGALSVFYMPSFLANAASAGQCDIWYSACMLASVYYVLMSKPTRALVWFGLAISFKCQGIWLAPFLLLCLIKGLIPWRSIWIVPAVFLLTQLPAWIEGRNLSELLLIYWRQFNTYHYFGNAANPYSLLGKEHYAAWHKIAVGVALVINLFFVFIAYRHWKIPNGIPKEKLVVPLMLLATLAVTLAPFSLPKMLDRYFFPAELFALVLFWMRPTWIMTWLIQAATLLTYPSWQFPWVKWVELPFSRQGTAVALCSTAFAMLILLYVLYIWRTKAATNSR